MTNIFCSYQSISDFTNHISSHLQELCEEGRDVPDDDFEGVQLGDWKDHFTHPCKYDSDTNYTSAVLKIARKEEHTLTDAERRSVEHCRKQPLANTQVSPASPSRKPKKKSTVTVTEALVA